MRTLRLAALLAVSLALPGIAPSGIAWADQDNYVEIARGRALATAGDCVACHTAPGGQSFAGGLGLDTPFGTITTPNLTPDLATGIGHWTADDFYTAMHEGSGPGGYHLYPAFPYTAYTKVTRADTNALFAFLQSLPAVDNPVDRNSLPFPFSIRAAMRGWNMLFFTPGTFKPDPKRSEEFNRGAYLVEGLGHCGICHTPMNTFGANKTDAAYQSNQLGGWTAPNITNDPRLGLGKWTADEIVQYLATGHNAHSAASGPMAEVVMDSTSHMPQSDLHAMAVYLKERGAAGSAAPTPIAATDPRMRAGQAVYVDTCSACHTATGAGIANLFPPLAGNAVVQQDEPTTLARIVISGVRAAATDAAPTAPAMPSLGWRLTDAQVASVLTYIRNSWGNAAPAVSASDVSSVREQVTVAGP